MTVVSQHLRRAILLISEDSVHDACWCVLLALSASKDARLEVLGNRLAQERPVPVDSLVRELQAIIEELTTDVDEP